MTQEEISAIASARREFIIKNLGKMTAQQMADELGMKRMSVNYIIYCYRQENNIRVLHKGDAICWECEKATDFSQCVWVDTLEQMPEGVKLDDNGTIIECPEFKQERIRNVKSDSRLQQNQR